MHDKFDVIPKLFRLAEDTARTMADIAEMGDAYLEDDVRPGIQHVFAKIVSARVAAIQQEELKPHKKWPMESEEDYVSRVAQDAAGWWLQEQRGRIAAMLCKPGI